MCTSAPKGYEGGKRGELRKEMEKEMLKKAEEEFDVGLFNGD
jgi:hypothetical protein